jgi:hypothetical protein
MKKSSKVLRKPSSEPFWETPNRPPKKNFVEDRYDGKEGGLRT